MKQLKILIAVATWNRPNVTRLCLESLQDVRGPNAAVMIYDDCSSAYDASFLDPYCDGLLRFRLHGGIERSRARAFRDFVHRYSEFDILYLTDNDTIHDPVFIDVLNEFFAEQANYPFAHPVGLFRSVFHENAIEQQFDKFVVCKTCPGVSQAYDREMAEKIVQHLNSNPMMETVYGWDYHWPAVLNRPFLISTKSYVEHLGRDKEEGGLHCPVSNPRDNLERDRALYPTDYLISERKQVISELFSSAQANTLPNHEVAKVFDKRILRARLAHRYLKGTGIEIGALATPLDVRPNTRVLYVDRKPVDQLLIEYPEMKNRELRTPDVIDNGETLSTFDDSSLDFIIANHFLEHCENFLGTLHTHFQKIRVGGHLFYAVPNRDHTFDRHRPITTFEHLVKDYTAEPLHARSEHYYEWAKLVEGLQADEARTRAHQLELDSYSIHFHVWDAHGLFSALSRGLDQIGNPGFVAHFEQNGHELICILKRTA